MRRRSVLAAAIVITAAASTAQIASAGDQPTAQASASTVNVSGKEFAFTLSPSSAKAGSVTFKFTNKGRLKHDFKIAGKQTKILSKGKSQSITVKLKKGSYSYLCTVKGHAAAGMKGKFRVR
jgi:plastocyanin